MQCYVCEQSGVESEAIAICIVCGMAVCRKHLVRSDVEMWEGGYPFPRPTAKKTIPRVLCQECHNALVVEKK